MKSRPELLSGTGCRGRRTNGFLDSGIEPPTEVINLGPGGIWNRKLKVESSRIDGIGLVWLDLERTWILELELDRNGTLTGTGLVSRIDVIGLVVDSGNGTNISESDRCDRTQDLSS